MSVQAEICEWCDKEITDTPLIHDEDLDIHFHYECGNKDDAINDLWMDL